MKIHVWAFQFCCDQLVKSSVMFLYYPVISISKNSIFYYPILKTYDFFLCLLWSVSSRLLYFLNEVCSTQDADSLGTAVFLLHLAPSNRSFFPSWNCLSIILAQPTNHSPPPPHPSPVIQPPTVSPVPTATPACRRASRWHRRHNKTPTCVTIPPFLSTRAHPAFCLFHKAGCNYDTGQAAQWQYPIISLTVPVALCFFLFNGS